MKLIDIKLFLVILFLCASVTIVLTQQCSSKDMKEVKNRYLLYSVNPGEGFNLRRDVFIRVANLVKLLNDDNCKEYWTLVLPTWHSMYHWFNSRSENHGQAPWSDFFDLESFNKYIPVIELHDYIDEFGHSIDEVYSLQHHDDTFSGSFKPKYEEAKCKQEISFWKTGSGFEGSFCGFSMHSPRAVCLSVMGTASTVAPLLRNSKKSSTALLHAEVLLHDHYSDDVYWQARASMRFAENLQLEAEQFRRKELACDAEEDVKLLVDWREMKKGEKVSGCPYLSIHLRRRDFLRARPSDVPSLSHAAKQIKKYAIQLSLETVFVATDAPNSEIAELETLLRPLKLVTFKSEKKYTDGQLAIIDQIIAAHARFFVGSFESTFSFRIQEEREILSFDSSTTFNRLCGDEQMKCDQPTQWKIVY